jgi:hypothetical protein
MSKADRALTALESCNESSLKFGRWISWQERRKHAREHASLRGRGGLYLLGCFPDRRAEVEPTAGNLPSGVIYIGDAKDLNRRPLTGGHSELDAYRRLTGDNELRCLFVSIADFYPTNCDDYEHWRICSAYFESKLIWDYTRKHRRPPLLRFKNLGVVPPILQREADRLRAAIEQARGTS